ncbi:unnamed protein product, partial [Linum tenue]
RPARVGGSGWVGRLGRVWFVCLITPVLVLKLINRFLHIHLRLSNNNIKIPKSLFSLFFPNSSSNP